MEFRRLALAWSSLRCICGVKQWMQNHSVSPPLSLCSSNKYKEIIFFLFFLNRETFGLAVKRLVKITVFYTREPGRNLSAPDSSLLTQTLGGYSDGSGDWVPETHTDLD